MVIDRPTIAPNKRLQYSIHAKTILNVAGSICDGICSMLVGGIQRPKHFGQSGQPIPAPATLTNPPINISR